MTVRTPPLDGYDISYARPLNGQPLPACEMIVTRATRGTAHVDTEVDRILPALRAARQVRHVGLFHYLSAEPAGAQFDHYATTIEARGGLRDGEFAEFDFEQVSRGVEVPVDVVLGFAQLCIDRWPGRVIGYSYAGHSAWRPVHTTFPALPLWLSNLNIGQASKPSGWELADQFDVTAWQWTYTAPARWTKFGSCDGSMVRRPDWFRSLWAFDPARRLWRGWFEAYTDRQLPVCKVGSTGDAVKVVQAVTGAGVDGQFGPRTRAKVIAFQRVHHLTVDGIVGARQTWPAIRAEALKEAA